MSTTLVLQKLLDVRELPAANPLHERVWQPWVARDGAEAGSQ
jgi:hypothetical protein